MNSLADLFFLCTDNFLPINQRQTLESARLFLPEATHCRFFPGEDVSDFLRVLADVERWEAIKLAAFLTLDAVGCGDFPVVDGAEADCVIAGTVVEGSGEMYLRDWSLELRVLQYRAGFDVFYLWIDDRNGICTSF